MTDRPTTTDKVTGWLLIIAIITWIALTVIAGITDGGVEKTYAQKSMLISNDSGATMTIAKDLYILCVAGGGMDELMKPIVEREKTADDKFLEAFKLDK